MFVASVRELLKCLIKHKLAEPCQFGSVKLYGLSSILKVALVKPMEATYIFKNHRPISFMTMAMWCTVSIKALCIPRH